MPKQNNRESVDSSKSLFVVFPESIFRGKKKATYSNQDRIKWIYLEDNPIKRCDIADHLGKSFELIDIARLHRRIAEEGKNEYVRWHDEINRSYKDGLGWWFGAVSSRNIRQSNIFHYYCFLETLKHLWDDPLQRPRLVVVESEALAESIRRWAVAQGIPVEIVGGWKMFVRRLMRYGYAVLRWGKFWCVGILRSLAVFLLRLRGLPPLKDQNDDCLVVTTVHDHSLSSKGEFTDRYFPLLHPLLQKQGAKVLICPFFYGFGFNYFSIYHRLRISKTRFVLPEDLLSFMDYWDIVIYPLSVLPRCKKVNSFRGFDLGPVIREEFCEQDVVLALEPLLIYKAYLRMAGKFPSLKKAIIWYENRVIDRAVVMGLRCAFPLMKITGSQMYMHPHFFLSMAPSGSEIEAGIVPHLILTTSEHESRKARAYSSEVNCQPAAGLRYQHLFEKMDVPMTYKYPDGSLWVLILLSYDIGEAIEILRIVTEAMPYINKNIRFLIKAHPNYKLEHVRQGFNEGWPAYFESFTGHLTEGLAKSDMVISGMTSAMVEAAVKGVPVIFVGGQSSLEENYMSDLDLEMTVNCFNAKELAEAVGRYASLSSEQREDFRKAGMKVRETYFLPVNETTLQPFLG
jgi:hypothetical protein